MSLPMLGEREIRLSACEGKTRFRDSWRAKKVMNKMIATGKTHGEPPLNVYRCRWCHGWHIGHSLQCRSRQ